MHLIIASDSFKGTLSSTEICALFAHELKAYAHIKATYIPIGDGGENSLDAISANIKGKYITLKASDPYFAKITVRYFLDEQQNAYIESATSAGLHLVTNLNAGLTTTYGVGEQINDALRRGAKTIYVFLGGSATNDGGAGLFAALGTQFINKEGTPFIPTGNTLIDITAINNEKTNTLLKDVNIIGLADVQNVLFGKKGAAYVYAPQKGANNDDVKMLDRGLRHYSSVLERDLGKNISALKGGGAAGGLGAALVAFGNGKLLPGIETVLDLVKFDEALAQADYVITGEGKLDHQSFYGKVISGVSRRAAQHNVNVVLVVGNTTIKLHKAQRYYKNITNIYETNPAKFPFEIVKRNAVDMYKNTAKAVLNEINKQNKKDV